MTWWSPDVDAGRHRSGSPVGSEFERSSLTEAHSVLLVMLGWTAAWYAPSAAAPPFVLGVGVSVVLLGWWRQRTAIVALGLATVMASLGARAEQAYEPLPAGPTTAVATVVEDPSPVGAGWRAELRFESGPRVDAVAFGRVGADLSAAEVGQQMEIEGTVRSVGDRPWLVARHIVGRLSLTRIGPRSGPGPLLTVPRVLRQLVVDGAAALPDRQRALYLGLVIGDDRFQSAGQRLQFRSAGLSHLLAVSGQNVAFVGAVARPLLLLLGYRLRFVCLVVLLVLFAVITRGEPSVLRATTTAILAAWAATTGRERSGVHVLAAAVIVLLAIDPFLVDVVGFQLSVAASTGILVIGPVLERRIPGPGWLRDPLSVTVSAQLGVSPILLGHFGPISIAAVPANLLAGWAAAAVMVSGLTVGIGAGLVPPELGTVLQFPTRVLLSWIELVADFHGTAPAPRLGRIGLPVAVFFCLALVISRTTRGRLLIAGIAMPLAIVAAPRPPTGLVECGPALIWHPPADGRPSVLLAETEVGIRSIEGCLDAGVSEADVLLLEKGDRSTAEVAAALVDVVDIGIILAPPQHRVRGGHRVLETTRIETVSGNIEVRPDAYGRRLHVESSGRR